MTKIKIAGQLRYDLTLSAFSGIIIVPVVSVLKNSLKDFR
jgi:hypothetical protein